MSSSMALWDFVPSFSPADLSRPCRACAAHTCERCGREIPDWMFYALCALPYILIAIDILDC